MERDSRTLKTTETSTEILELLGELNGAGVTTLANELGMPLSTVHGHLATLHEQEFIIKEGDEYRLGLKFIELGKIVERSKQLYQRADTYTAKVATETDCRSIFAVEEHGWGVFISRNSGEHSDWAHEVAGQRWYLHATAAGKAILAHLPEAEVDEILDRRGLPALTENTITDRETLKAELETVRERGVAFNRKEQVKGVKAVSAPITSHSGQLLGALSANGPARQMIGDRFEERVPQTLRGIANEFELDLELASESDRTDRAVQ